MSVSSSSREIASGVDAEPGDADGRILQFDDVTLLPELLQWRRIGKEKRNLSNPITNFFFYFLICPLAASVNPRRRQHRHASSSDQLRAAIGGRQTTDEELVGRQSGSGTIESGDGRRILPTARPQSRRTQPITAGRDWRRVRQRSEEITARWRANTSAGS